MEVATAKDVQVYTWGLVCASVCAPKDLSTEEVLEGANLSHPTGLSHGWSVSDDATFADGKSPNPCECSTDPTRRHWLLNC